MPKTLNTHVSKLVFHRFECLRELARRWPGFLLATLTRQLTSIKWWNIKKPNKHSDEQCLTVACKATCLGWPHTVISDQNRKPKKKNKQMWQKAGWYGMSFQRMITSGEWWREEEKKQKENPNDIWTITKQTLQVFSDYVIWTYKTPVSSAALKLRHVVKLKHTLSTQIMASTNKRDR